jgi:four helix bundle protein
MRDFTRLDVWQKAHALTLTVYRNTESFPREETYGMRRQIRDAATSIESNIAEGCGRRTHGELINFLGMSSGSVSELQCRLLISHDLRWLIGKPFDALIRDIIAVRKLNLSYQKYLTRERDAGR